MDPLLLPRNDLDTRTILDGADAPEMVDNYYIESSTFSTVLQPKKVSQIHVNPKRNTRKESVTNSRKPKTQYT